MRAICESITTKIRASFFMRKINRINNQKLQSENKRVDECIEKKMSNYNKEWNV